MPWPGKLTDMAPLPAALAALRGETPAPMIAWRLDAERHAESWDSGQGAARFGGRWNPRGLRTVYASLDPATCVLEAAVHRGFAVLDSQPHTLTRLTLALTDDATPGGIRVVLPGELPNPAWLHHGVPSDGQQRWGELQLRQFGVLLLPSVVSRHSWNVVFAPDHAAGRWRMVGQQPLALDTRLNPPR